MFDQLTFSQRQSRRSHSAGPCLTINLMPTAVKSQRVESRMNTFVQRPGQPRSLRDMLPIQPFYARLYDGWTLYGSNSTRFAHIRPSIYATTAVQRAKSGIAKFSRALRRIGLFLSSCGVVRPLLRRTSSVCLKLNEMCTGAFQAQVFLQTLQQR